MSKTRQLALPLETHRNHYLFSDHFLNQVLPGQHVWRESEAEARQALDAIVELYSRLEDALPHYNEAALEQEWIRPILDVLGHVYHVQPSLTGAAGTPDYAFFTDEPAKQAAALAWGAPAFWETALGVGDAKRWDRPLDKRLLNGAPDAFTNANPCFQINYYLQRTGCTWGVLSNGRRWRLYHRETSSQLDIFYEVDLAQLIGQDDLAAFRYFYLFFRAVAFHPDAEEPALSLPKGRCWLGEVLAQSTAYAVHVGDELKGRVYEALRLLAQGFLDYPTNRVFSEKPGLCLDPATDLSRVHDGCLILLYRLLFLLYAESRGLLPLNNPSYAGQYSLKAIKEDIAHKLDGGITYLAEKATIWDDLRTLFDIIYSGQEALGVPAYDGRLFDPNRYPFLEGRTIGDKYLAQAIDLLARAGAGPGQDQSFVDYRDLSIRHLGSIYEGLLEYRLAHAAEEMAVVRRGKREEIVPSSEIEKPGFSEKTRFLERIPSGQVYLVTDRGERKATGSYYTPGYIVEYIVEQTLGPLADSQAEAVEKEIAALKAKNKGGARRTRAYKEELARLQNSFADRVLALNLLDPAMGSGHFLVEATGYLARRIVEAGVITEALTDGSTEPVLSGAEGLTGTGDEESELSYWRRRVVERCIYGVDLNPLAVELAKLSLWLKTVAKGKPLSFLDHHLRCGNSLIGARVADLQALPVRKKTRRVSKTLRVSEASQLAMWDEDAFTQDMYRVVGAMRQIGEYETADLVGVKEKERLFEETVERERHKWRQIADLWTATYFGLELTPELYNACVQYAQGKPVMLQAAQAEALLAQAREIWEEKRFFHWEIEFPEVFFDEYGQHKGDAAGFDVVVGNPPYGMPTDEQFREYVRERYPSSEGRDDHYKIFAELAFRVGLEGSYLSYITPNTILTNRFDAKLRKILLSETAWLVLVTFGFEVFEDPTVHSAVFVLNKGTPQEGSLLKIIPAINAPEELERAGGYWAEQQSFLRDELCLIAVVESEPAAKIIAKLSEQGQPLGEIAHIRQCIKTGNDRVYLRTCDTPPGPPWVAVLAGGDVTRYCVDWPNRYLKYGPWLARNWQNPSFFERPKIVVRETSGRITAAIDREQYYLLSTLYSIYYKDVFEGNESLEYLLAVMNSGLAQFFMHHLIFGLTTGAFTKARANHYARLPIRRIPFTTPPEERERLVGDGIAEAAEWTERAEKASVTSATFSAFSDSKLARWLNARLSAEPEQSDVVHDLLAHLGGRMIEMHKEKQAEVRGFLDWLAEYTGRPVDDWALKTHLRRYYDHDWAEMQRVLKRNQRKLPKVDLDVDAYKNEPAARIRAAWDTSMETLRPLLARIEATDRLIDCIVYQLYGLTEEEIETIEAST